MNYQLSVDVCNTMIPIANNINPIKILTPPPPKKYIF